MCECQKGGTFECHPCRKARYEKEAEQHERNHHKPAGRELRGAKWVRLSVRWRAAESVKYPGSLTLHDQEWDRYLSMDGDTLAKLLENFRVESNVTRKVVRI